MKKFIVLLAIFMLAGCSTKFAYKNVDWLVYWYIDDYIEMNNQQEEQFDAYVVKWKAWHMQTELPKYQAHLEELAEDILQQNISIERMQYHQNKGRDHWLRFREHIAPDIADLAMTMSQEQITYFFAALEKENVEDEEKWQERLARSEKKRRDRWTDRNVDNLENWLGRLTDEQERVVENSFDNFESMSEHWIQYKRDYQQALRSEFASPNRDDIFRQNMIALINEPEQYRSAEMLRLSELNGAESKRYLLVLFTLSTEIQRNHLIKEINDLRDDVIELSNGN